jgi:hypothetical protein
VKPVWAVSTFVPVKTAFSASKVRAASVAEEEVEAGADEVDVDVEEARVLVDVVVALVDEDVVVYFAGQYGAALAPAANATMPQTRCLRDGPIVVDGYKSGVVGGSPPFKLVPYPTGKGRDGTGCWLPFNK